MINTKQSFLVVSLLLVVSAPLAVPCGAVETAANVSPPVAPPPPNVGASPLVVMLKHAAFTGWDEVGTKAFVISNGRLAEATLPSAGDVAAGEASGMLSLPLSSNDVPSLGEFRCKVLVQKIFKRGNRYITIKAFEFAKPEGANAGYDLLRKGSTTVLKRGDGSSEDADSISFWQDSFLFLLSGTSQDDDESKEVITSFADYLSKGAITHAPPPAILSKLPVIDRVRGTEKIVMGPISASRYFSAPQIAALSIDKARAAAVADYQVLQPMRERMKLLYIDYGDNTLAQTAYNAYLNALSELHEPEKGTPADNRVLFKLNKTFLLSQLRQPGKVIVISGAKKAKSPMLLAGQIMDR